MEPYFYLQENVLSEIRKVAFTLNDLAHYHQIDQNIDNMQEWLVKQIATHFLLPGENLQLQISAQSIVQISSLDSLNLVGV